MATRMSDAQYTYYVRKVIAEKNDLYGTDVATCMMGDVQIIETNDSFSKRNDPVVFGVNWAALGTCDTAETLKFANKLKVATKIAEELTNMQMIRDYSIDDDDFVNKAIESVERGMIDSISLEVLKSMHIIN